MAYCENNKSWDQLQEKYGHPFDVKLATNEITKFNPHFVAHYLSLILDMKFCVKMQAFIEYNEGSGVWEYLSDNKAHEVIWLSIRGLSTTFEPTLNAINTSLVSSVMKLMKSVVEYEAKSLKDTRFFHANNCMVVFDMKTGIWTQEAFSQNFYSHDQSKIIYDPSKKCPRFLDELVRAAMTEADIEILQLYLGQCLLTTNISQMFLLLEGTPGGGKSTLVNIIEKIIGKEHCAELRAAHTTGRFEIAGLYGKKLLTGKDVSSEFLNNAGGRALKFLTGNDTVTAEYKNSNKRVNVDGNFNIIITSNNTIILKFDGDKDAWRRRILLIKYDNPPPKKKIANFDDVLISEEGSGILNWMMKGAVKLVQNGGIITKNNAQKAAVDNLLKSSDPLVYFAENYIHPVPQAAMTSAEVVEMFTKFCHKHNWGIPTERAIQQRLRSYMSETYGASISHSIKKDGKSKRGFYNFQITNKK